MAQLLQLSTNENAGRAQAEPWERDRKMARRIPPRDHRALEWADKWSMTQGGAKRAIFILIFLEEELHGPKLCPTKYMVLYGIEKISVGLSRPCNGKIMKAKCVA